MEGLCESGNEPSGSLKAICNSTKKTQFVTHRSPLMSEFLAKSKMPVLPQPPYSPDLAPADFYLFLKNKSLLKRRRFASAVEVKATGVAQSVKALACRSEIALGRGFDPRLR
ncbi:hypothetical protein ANN_12760 [Periplaneta americana]|uniref:Histone-lysine N-methyltransferase SETMAR n=1 Tax=Periplaneta americana TaxID=6978 RepID=A0ABQ8TI08_PERAM|nr:hypothetical protein ANN_12760 [Periplaneta americana]